MALPTGAPRATATFAVRLSARPRRSVTVTSTAAITGDTNLTVIGGAALTFTRRTWQTSQSVTLAAAEDRPGRRPVMAPLVAIHDVVMEQREVVDELDGHGAVHCDLGRAIVMAALEGL